MPGDALQRGFDFVIGERTVQNRVTPYYDETLLSILTRIVGRTGHSYLVALCPKLGMTRAEVHRAPWLGGHTSRIAEVCGFPEDEVTRRMYGFGGSKLGLQHAMFSGGPIGQSYVSTKRRAVSPASLRIAPYHRMAWDLVQLGFCPESNERLIDRCPLCSKELTWLGTSVCHCHACRFDLRKHVESGGDVKPPMYLSKLANALSPFPSLRAETVAQLPSDLRSLTGGELLQSAILIGLATRRLLDPKAPSMRRSMGKGSSRAESAEILGYGSQVLFDMREYFSDILTETRNIGGGSKSNSPIRNELGDLYDLIDPSVVGQAISDVFSARIKDHYQKSYSPFDKTTSSTVLLKWCDQVMSYDEVIASVTTKQFHAEKMRSLRTLKVGRGAKSLAYRRDKVRELIIDLENSTLQTVLKKKYGMPNVILDGLIQKKVIKRSPSLVEEILGPGRLDEADLRQWVRSIEAKLEEPRDSEPVRLKEAIRHLGTGDAAWRRVIDLIQTGQVPLVGVREDVTALTVRWSLCRRSLASHLPVPTAKSGTALTVMLAHVGLRARKAAELGRLQVIRTAPCPKNSRVSTVDQAELDRFRSSFTTPVALASEWGVPVKFVIAWLREANVEVIGSGRPNVYRLDDVKRLLASGKEQFVRFNQHSEDRTVFLLQYLRIPIGLEINNIKTRISTVQKSKQKSLIMLIKIISGFKLSDIIKDHGTSCVLYFLSSIRRRGIERHLIRKQRNQYILSSKQRADLISKAQEFIARNKAGERFSLFDVRQFIIDEFSIEYSVTNISTYLRRSGVKWPSVNEGPRSLDGLQLKRYAQFSNDVATRIRNGERGLTRNTVKDWVLSEFGVTISENAVSKYNKECGVLWPEMTGRKIARKTGRPEKYKGQQKFSADQWEAYKSFSRQSAAAILSGDRSISKTTIQRWVKSELGIDISLGSVKAYNKIAGVEWPRGSLKFASN